MSGRYRADEWQNLREDPIREDFLARGAPPDLDRILGLFPRTTGDPAFDPDVIARAIDRLETEPEVNTGHPFLDLSVKTGLVFIDATFRGDHPKYGVKRYGRSEHDAFPPTIIAAVDALSTWGLGRRAAQLFRYWLTTFVRDDGTIDYYGPSISEYGQLLHTAAVLVERAGTEGWWEQGFGALDRIAGHLLRLREQAEPEDGLLFGSPEADMREDRGKYFHNNAWAAKGLARWADACEGVSASPVTSVSTFRSVARALTADTLAAIEQTWREDPDDWWLPPQVEPVGSPTSPVASLPASERPGSLTSTRLASYANYRYWPELLSSGVLPAEAADRVIEARLSAGGQFCGMTRFGDGLDDWPLAEYLLGLWSLGRKDDFLVSLYGHVAYHQADEHLTAYEQITAPPFRERAPYCLPCQLVAARAARLLVGEAP